MINNDLIFFLIYDVKLILFLKKWVFLIFDNIFNNEINYSCFVMDDIGYIVMYDDFVYVLIKVLLVEGVYII